MAKRAVLLLAHGTPNTVEEIPEYLRNVVSGRPMPQHVVEEIQHRYSLIGEPKGHSPLTDLTMEQGELLAAALGEPVYVGMRNWRPYIADVVRQMRADGVDQIAAICLAPQNSRTSTGLYRRAVMAEAAGIRIDFIDGWAHEELLAEAFADRLRDAIAQVKATSSDPIHVLFTAHSVPCRTIQAAAASAGQPILWPSGRPTAPGGPGGAPAGESTPDPYPVEAKFTAQAVAALVPEVNDWYFAFQSQGVAGAPWIGPTVEDTLKALADSGHKGVVLQPVGFLCDHVEILYDIDIAFKETAHELGLQLWRAPSLNASPTLIRALVQVATGTFAAQIDEAPTPKPKAPKKPKP